MKQKYWWGTVKEESLSSHFYFLDKAQELMETRAMGWIWEQEVQVPVSLHSQQESGWEALQATCFTLSHVWFLMILEFADFQVIMSFPFLLPPNASAFN